MAIPSRRIRRRRTRSHLLACALIFTLSFSFSIVRVHAAPALNSEIDYLKNLGIEALLQTEVTSVSRRSEQLMGAAAAVFVITQEDIKRTGARNIPEALRMAPGLQVSQIDANKWAITARGFNDRFSNKLLVLMDGRSVYTPLFSGVYWDVQDTLLEDVDRIEIIRGPGATLWGANAVNGVINIITKPAKDTVGGLVTAGAGTVEKAIGAARYGGKIGNDTHFRIFAKGFSNGDYGAPDGNTANDSWESVRGGFRLDTAVTNQSDLTLQGDLYDGKANQTIQIDSFLTPPFSRKMEDKADVNGGNILTRWRQKTSKSSDITFQFYYDRTSREEGILAENRDTIDFDFQQRWQATARNEVVWGAGYRFTKDSTQGSYYTTLTPADRSDDLWSAFLENDFMLVTNQLWLTLGAKIEHNDYTGMEFQPSGRLRWKPTPNHTLWAAVSKAARTPSRADSDLRVNLTTFNNPLGPPGNLGLFRVIGSDNYESEKLTAYELGYRWESDRRLSWDIAGFYNHYDKFRSLETGPGFLEFSPGPPHVVIPLTINNKMEAETFGVEALVSWQPVDFWRLSVGYSWLEIQMHPDGDSNDTRSSAYEGSSPKQQFQARSYLDLPLNLSLNTELYYVDSISAFEIPHYMRLDLRLGWEPSKNWAFSLNGENLLDHHHPELGDISSIQATEVPRSFFGKITWRF